MTRRRRSWRRRRRRRRKRKRRSQLYCNLPHAAMQQSCTHAQGNCFFPVKKDEEEIKEEKEEVEEVNKEEE